MTGWTTFTDKDVLAQFNDSEKDVYDQARGDTKGQSLPDICGKVVDEIRQAYADGGRDVDPASGTIPDGEKNRAIDITRWRFLNALPCGKSLADNRQSGAKAAQEYFLMLAKRELKGSGGAEIVSGNTRRATRCRLDGLN